MKKRSILGVLVAMSVQAGVSVSAPTIDDSIKVILEVEKEGRGNKAASVAWKELSNGSGEDLVTILAAMDGAGPLAANWLRGAVGTISDRELADSKELPLAALGEFLMDTTHDPRARKLAFDLISRVDQETVDQLVPGMLMDPSPELRIGAVAQLSDRAKELVAAGKESAAAIVYRQALQGARDVKQIQAIAKALRELGREVDLPRHFGFLMHWKVIGPFDNTERGGFEKVFPPEETIDFAKGYPGKTGEEAKWIDFVTADELGMVDINKAYGMLKEVTAYAVTDFESETARPAQLRLGCKNAWKIWLNNELVFARDEYHRGAKIDMYQMPISLKAGKNRILVKLCQNEQKETWTVQWQFQLRVCDATGTAILASNRPATPAEGTDLQKPKARRGAGAKADDNQ